MNNSSLMEIIRALSPAELKGFSEFLHSPFFNKNKNVVKLYEFILKQAPHFHPEKIKKDLVYKKLFGERYNDGFMRTMIFLLTNLAEEYLAYLNYKNDKYNSAVSLLEELKYRNINRILVKNIKSFERDLQKENIKDPKYFRALYTLEGIKNDSQIIKYKTLDKKEVSEDLTLKILDHNIIEFLMHSMASCIYILNRKHLVNIEEELPFMDEVLKHMSENQDKYKDLPELLNLYYQLRINIEPFNEEYYNDLKRLIFKNKEKIDYIENYNALVGMQNFCMRLYNNGNGAYLEELFNVMEFVLKHGFYSAEPGGYFVPQQFKNFVIVGTNLKKFEWTESFIKNYVKKLDSKNRENAYNFSMAKVFFAKKDFEKALWYISRVSYQDLYYKLEVRNQTLMIFYELSMYSEAYDLMESYKKFIQNNKIISPLLKQRHSYFIKYTSELLKIKLSGNFKKIRQLEKEIKSSTKTLGGPWLLIKLDDLCKKFGYT